jgi:hypothetical protein
VYTTAIEIDRVSDPQTQGLSTLENTAFTAGRCRQLTQQTAVASMLIVAPCKHSRHSDMSARGDDIFVAQFRLSDGAPEPFVVMGDSGYQDASDDQLHTPYKASARQGLSEYHLGRVRMAEENINRR